MHKKKKTDMRQSRRQVVDVFYVEPTLPCGSAPNSVGTNHEKSVIDIEFSWLTERHCTALKESPAPGDGAAKLRNRYQATGLASLPAISGESAA